MSGLEYWTKRILQIPTEEETRQDRITRGESVVSSHHADPYIGDDPTIVGYVQDHIPTREDVREYVLSLFPFIQWLPNYNRIWLLGDMIAGITIGVVVVPQGMAYAKLALLPPEFGLYSSFVGVLFYFAFATSKDITIGPVAVMSTLTGQIITRVLETQPQYADTPWVIGQALAILCGAFVFALGIFRLGFIVDFIPLPAIGAFMTGSAINIAVGQICNLMGITGFSTRDATYKVFIHILEHLGRTQIDAALGLTSLFLLYAIRSACNYGARKQPHRAKLYFFLSTLRTAFVILLYVLVSWLVNRNRKKKPLFAILKNVPRGFKHMGTPQMPRSLVVAIAKELPGAIIVLLIEHIAISKSFGRINNYTINPSQELIAIGFTNLFGPFFGAYPATGSFSRTAIKSKAGVRTPLAGVITAVVVLLAIYALPPVFFYIPSSALAAVIIHAVGDLITPPSTVYAWWRVSPPEVIIFFAGVIGSVFGTIEIGIYTTIASTAGLMLFRIAKSRGDFLGKVTVFETDQLRETTRTVYLPINHADGSNPSIPIEEPIPGVFVYRVRQSPIYPSVNGYTDEIVAALQARTRRTNAESFPKLGDRPWNMRGPRHIDPATIAADTRPTLKAVILDFSTVEHVDITSVQTFQDIRKQLDRHAAPDHVEWHFAGIYRPWVKRSLALAGFGRLPDNHNTNVKPMFSIAKIGDADHFDEEQLPKHDVETGGITETQPGLDRVNRQVNASLPIHSVDRSAFHIDVVAAVASVESRFGPGARSAPVISRTPSDEKGSFEDALDK